MKIHDLMPNFRKINKSDECKTFEQTKCKNLNIRPAIIWQQRQKFYLYITGVGFFVFVFFFMRLAFDFMTIWAL